MKYTTEKFIPECGCRSAGECQHGAFAERRAISALVDDFAGTMKSVLLQKIPHKSGWDDPDWSLETIEFQLLIHVFKAIERRRSGASRMNDVVDIANFAAFWWNKQIEGFVPLLAADRHSALTAGGDWTGKQSIGQTRRSAPMADRILSREELTASVGRAVDADRYTDKIFHAQRVCDHDYNQRERIATLDEEIRRLNTWVDRGGVETPYICTGDPACGTIHGFAYSDDGGKTRFCTLHWFTRKADAAQEEIRRLEQERFTAENHRVGLMAILGVQGGTFADAVAVIEAKDDEIQRLKSIVDADSTEMERLRGCALQAERERDAAQADSRRLREALEKITQISFAAENGQAVAWEIARAALQPSPVQSGADCKTCGGTKRVMRVIKQYGDAYAGHYHLKFSDCPDCTAAPQLSGEAEEKDKA